jgi:uncharacterized cupin superfamily protein
MRYTLRNLRDIDDSAAAFGYGEVQESRFPREAVGAVDVGFAHHALKPGKRSPFGHRHETAEEVHVVLRGSGRLKLDDDVVEVRPLDVIRVAPDVARAFEAGEDGLEYLVFGPRREGDGALLPEFWGS